MNQLTKTTLVVLALVAGISTGAFAQEKSIRLDQVKKDLYSLTYQNVGACHIQVEITDIRGKKLLSEVVKENKSFSKPYSLRKLEPGEYIFSVIDTEGVYVTKILRTDDVPLAVKIDKVDHEKANIIVKGEMMSPIYVNIFDKDGVMVFGDYIDREKSFSKIYDLSNVKSTELRIEVASDRKLLAAAKF